VEATNSRQELFGFDRLRNISTEEAQRIAETAKRFGQEDDITVLTLRRLSVPIKTRVEATARLAAFQQVRKADA
jgi:hypothetical protein